MRSEPRLVGNGRPRPLARAEPQILARDLKRAQAERRRRREAFASAWGFVDRHGLLPIGAIVSAAVTFAALVLFAVRTWR